MSATKAEFNLSKVGCNLENCNEGFLLNRILLELILNKIDIPY
jgi:hypothetical protein